MKTKKLLSLLLAALMVLTILPMTAFAAKTSKAFLKVNVIGTFYNPNTDSHQYFNNLGASTTVEVAEGEHPEYPVTYYFSYETYYGSAKSSYYGQKGYKLVVKIGDIVATGPNAWVFDKDMSNVSGSGQTFHPIYVGGGNNYQNSIRINGGTPIDTAPSAPSDAVVNGLVFVIVKCVNADVSHPSKTYSLIDGSYTIGSVTGNASSGYSCTVTIHAAKYVDQYSGVNQIGVAHTLRSGETTPKTVTLVYNSTSKTWSSKDSSNDNVTFEVVCETPEVIPEKPSADDVKEALGNAVKVDCINAFAGHPEKACALIDGSFVVGDVRGDKETGYTVTVTVQPDKYVTKYNSDVGDGHELSPANQSASFVLKYNKQTEKWELYSQSGIPFTVDCYAKPALPTDDDLKVIFKDGAIRIDCVNMFANHADQTYSLLSGSYEFGPITDDYRVTLTVRLQPYVDQYSSDIGFTHHLMENSTGSASFTLRYNANLNKWELITGAPVIVYIDCDAMPAGPSADDVKRIFGEAVKVDCVNESASHADKTYGLLDNGFSISSVRLDKENGYLVDVTIMPDAYVKKYNVDTAAEHKLSPSTQGSKVFTLRLEPVNDELAWVMYKGDNLPITYTVTCKQDVKPDPKPNPRPIDDSRPKPTGDLTRRDENPNTGAHNSAELVVLAAAFSTLGACTVIAARKKKNAK